MQVDCIKATTRSQIVPLLFSILNHQPWKTIGGVFSERLPTSKYLCSHKLHDQTLTKVQQCTWLGMTLEAADG